MLDQRYLVAALVVAEFVDQAAGEHDSEASFAKAKLVADLDVADRVFVGGGVREVPGVKAGTLVGDDQRDRR